MTAIYIYIYKEREEKKAGRSTKPGHIFSQIFLFLFIFICYSFCYFDFPTSLHLSQSHTTIPLLLAKKAKKTKNDSVASVYIPTPSTLAPTHPAPTSGAITRVRSAKEEERIYIFVEVWINRERVPANTSQQHTTPRGGGGSSSFVSRLGEMRLISSFPFFFSLLLCLSVISSLFLFFPPSFFYPPSSVHEK
eukprot:gene10963-7608_t